MTAASASSWPGSRDEFWSWQVEAACRSLGPALFYSPEGERGPSKRRREHADKAICGSCRVVEVCAASALASWQRGP